MTPEQLAHELDVANDHGYCRDAAIMIRQQQAEIESMQERMIVAEKELNHMRSFFGCDPAYYEMTPAKPVAWIDYLKHSDVYDLNVSGRGQPLYMHPAKKLTEKEIAEIIKEQGWVGVTGYLLTFAHAILKKVNEK